MHHMQKELVGSIQQDRLSEARDTRMNAALSGGSTSDQRHFLVPSTVTNALRRTWSKVSPTTAWAFSGSVRETSQETTMIE